MKVQFLPILLISNVFCTFQNDFRETLEICARFASLNEVIYHLPADLLVKYIMGKAVLCAYREFGIMDDHGNVNVEMVKSLYRESVFEDESLIIAENLNKKSGTGQNQEGSGSAEANEEGSGTSKNQNYKEDTSGFVFKHRRAIKEAAISCAVKKSTPQSTALHHLNCMKEHLGKILTF